MFSFFGHKKKHKSSPDESPKHDDGYVFVDGNKEGQAEGGGGGGGHPPPGGSAYPNVEDRVSYPVLPYPPLPLHRQSSQGPGSPVKDSTFLQGVPFSVCKELSLGDDDMTEAQLVEILTFLSTKSRIASKEYDFNLERSVLHDS